MNKIYTLIVCGKFDAAHFLPDYDGKCKNVHGHTWNARIGFEYDTLDEIQQYGEDFKILKNLLDVVLDRYDHQLINEVFPDITPTAENLSNMIFWALEKVNNHIVWVELWETDSSGVRYEPKH